MWCSEFYLRNFTKNMLIKQLESLGKDLGIYPQDILI